MRRALAAWLLALSLAVPVGACLWDRDTPRREAIGLGEVVNAISGRFPRYPDLYYQMRLERVAAHLKVHPEDLAAYDDAGVACDRLGRGDEAIAWMDRKRAVLDGLDVASPGVKEHRYRYHANRGTFLVHRWFQQGADRSRLDEVRAAHDEIAAALAINPDAHHGREVYQLKAIAWILDPPQSAGQQYLPNLLGWGPDRLQDDRVDPKDARRAVVGLAGLVTLGNAWESVDIFLALDVALQHDTIGFPGEGDGRAAGRNTLAYLAWLRACELVDAGRGSILPDAPRGAALKAMLPRPDFIEQGNHLPAVYREQRQAADAWAAGRTAFLMERLRAGRHPDTDSGFWKGYTETPAPELPAESVSDTYNASRRWRERVGLAILLSLVLGAVGIVILVTRWLRRLNRPAPLSTQDSGITYLEEALP
jgi:hypothetical protein